MTYYDSTNIKASLWSQSDTFTTSSFVASQFNPIITTTLGSLNCDMEAELHLEITQSADEPDISTSSITSDGGYFNIQSISAGDSVGYAVMLTNTQTITSILKAGLIIGPDYAIINSYDTSGSLIGFFSIENTSQGIKVETTSPNDGNNYTSGYVSEISFSQIFITPAITTQLNFNYIIDSELNDQVIGGATFNITCNTTKINEIEVEKKLQGIYNFLGQKIEKGNNKILFFKFSDGTIEKKIVIKK